MKKKILKKVFFRVANAADLFCWLHKNIAN